MAYSEDHIALAAEYALGTLDADERAQVETMMSADKDFTAMVQAWEYRLGVLNQMVGPVEPRPEVWDKIRTAAGLSEPQAPLVLPEAPPPSPAPPEAVAPAAAAADNSNIILLSARVRRWRNVATFTTAIPPALVGAKLAHNRGRTIVGWALLSAIFPIFLMVIYFEKPLREVPGGFRRCASCGGRKNWACALCWAA